LLHETTVNRSFANKIYVSIVTLLEKEFLERSIGVKIKLSKLNTKESFDFDE
jgi:hypothetical protein